MRHNPNRNRFAFATPLKRQLIAWALVALAPVVASLWGLIAGAVVIGLAWILKTRRPHNDELADDLGDGIAGLDSSRY
jgi:cobalamin synthase